jgi:hypothetical protein
MPTKKAVRIALVVLASVAATNAQQRERDEWASIVKGGYTVPAGRKAADVLAEMNALLASPDPFLRDDVAFGSAERWIRAGHLDADDLRRLLRLWTGNLADGLGQPAGDGIFRRSFSALNLSLIGARDLTAPFLEPAEVQALFDRLLDYFDKELDTRGFDATRGWMHSVAHTADALKFVARNPKLSPGADVRLLRAVRDKIAASPTVFAWGENDRMALALQSAVRRSDADSGALTEWVDFWIGEHQKLWANGPHVEPARFARVENAKQVMRSLHTALAMEAKPTPKGDSARQIVLTGLANMR